MKVLKKATQKNLILCKDYYSVVEIQGMLENRECFYVNEKTFDICYNVLSYWGIKEKVFRIFTEDIEEIKVVYNKEFGCYETVAIEKNGKTYHVELQKEKNNI